MENGDGVVSGTGFELKKGNPIKATAKVTIFAD